MAVLTNQHHPNHQIAPNFIKIEKTTNAQNIDGVIIIDVILLTVPPRTTTTVFADPIWIRIESDYKTIVMSREPSMKLSPVVSAAFDTSTLYQKGGEVFIVEYSDITRSEPSDRTSVQGVQFGTNDVLYVQIEPSANKITIFKTA
jgi:L-fucose mutarotase/ribose pyranase (RbsD/FucU family)